MYTFEVHTYSPEQNKIFYRGQNISKLFVNTILTHLTKDYSFNTTIVRKYLKRYPDSLRCYWLIATRPNGTIEKRPFTSNSMIETLLKVKEAKQYYNIEGTKIEVKRIFKF